MLDGYVNGVTFFLRHLGKKITKRDQIDAIKNELDQQPFVIRALVLVDFLRVAGAWMASHEPVTADTGS